MIDSHCHLADEAFIPDLSGAIDRARAAGLTHALCILAAGNAPEAERAAVAGGLWTGVRTAVGVHPHHAGDFDGREPEAATLVERQLAADPLARAIGEAGLDYHYDYAPKQTQQRVFRAQIQLARRLDLPLGIHTREAEEDTLALLREDGGGPVRGVLHCFTGTQRLADAALELGLHLSFSGIITFPKSAALRAVAASVPEDRLLCETDSPYLAPTPYRGKRNEPAWVTRVAEELASLRAATTSTLRERLALNFTALFRP